MKTQEILKKIKATDIKISFYQDEFYGKVSFKINGVSFEGLFDIDNKGLYSIEIQSDLVQMGESTKNTNKTKNSDLSTNKTPFTVSDDALAEGFGWTGDANCLPPSFRTGDASCLSPSFCPNT